MSNKIDGDLVPYISGASHLGVDARGQTAFTFSSISPFGHVHFISGVIHPAFNGGSGILRAAHGTDTSAIPPLGVVDLQWSRDGGKTFQNIDGIDTINNQIGPNMTLVGVNGLTVTTAGNNNLVFNATGASGIQYESITVTLPTSSENRTMFYTNRAIRITRAAAILRGSASPSVTWSIRRSGNRAATGTELVTGGTTTTNTAAAQITTTFSDPDFAINNFVWFTTTAMAGVVNEISVTLDYFIL